MNCAWKIGPSPDTLALLKQRGHNIATEAFDRHGPMSTVTGTIRSATA